MCVKVPHENKQAARQVARAMAQKYNQSMGAYFCKQCESWHVETEGKPKKKNRRDNNKYPFRFHGKVKKKSKPKRR